MSIVWRTRWSPIGRAPATGGGGGGEKGSLAEPVGGAPGGRGEEEERQDEDPRRRRLQQLDIDPRRVREAVDGENDERVLEEVVVEGAAELRQEQRQEPARAEQGE